MKHFLLLLLLPILGNLSSHAQDGRGFQNLVFEGAGIRGVAYAGALEELESQQMLKEVKRVGGTSAGAITAMAFALGYTPGEIKAIVSTVNFNKLNDGKFFFAGGITRMTHKFGWYPGRKFDRWLEELIQAKTGKDSITFRELHEKGFKELYVTATDLTRQKMVIFSHEHTPDVKVCDAVRMSVSIPLYFQPLYMDNDNRVYRRMVSGTPMRVMVDGGIVSNFPIRIFDSTKYHTTAPLNQFSYHPQTLALRIDSKEQIRSDSLNHDLAEMEISDISSYLKAFYILVHEGLNRSNLTVDDWNRTVFICDGDLSPKIRKLKKTEVDKLMDCGHKGVVDYLAKQQKVQEEKNSGIITASHK